MDKRIKHLRAHLIRSRFWMGELHGWLWHHARTTDMMKQLQKDIKALDRTLEHLKGFYGD